MNMQNINCSTKPNAITNSRIPPNSLDQELRTIASVLSKEEVKMENKAMLVQVFTKAVIHQQDLGFFSEDGEDLPRIYYSPFFLIGVFMKLGLIGNIYKDYNTQSRTDLFNSLVFLTSLVFQASVAINFYLCGTRSTQFIARISRYNYGVSKNIVRLVRNFEKITGAVYNYIVYGYIVFSLMNHQSYSDCSKMKKGKDTELYFCGIYSQTWYPFPLDFTPVREIWYVMQVLELMYYIPKVSTSMVFFHGCIVLTEERIADLKTFLRKTEVNEKNADEVNKRLKFAAKKYIEISETVDAINSTIGLIFSPLQHVILLGLLVFLEFRIVLEGNMESVPLLVFWSSFEFIMCWRGQCLENASLSLERDVYEFPWYELHPSSRSLFKVFYGQVQVTLKLKSPPFICLNMQYYHEVMKGTYSFLMYLKRI